MLKRYWVHFACALFLLLAQQAALTHSVWHLGRLALAQHPEWAGDSHPQGPVDRSPQSTLCDLHFAFGSVAGAGHCSSQAVALESPASQWLPAPALPQRVAQPLATPPSRAPPILL